MEVDIEFSANPDMPPFAEMNKCVTHFKQFDTLAVQMMFQDKNRNVQIGTVLLGTEQNIRSMYEDMGAFEPEEIDALIAENAEKVHALGLENLMVENVLDAYERQFGGKDAGSKEADGPVLSLSDKSVFDVMDEEEQEEDKENEYEEGIDALMSREEDDSFGRDDESTYESGSSPDDDLIDDLGDDFSDM